MISPHNLNYEWCEESNHTNLLLIQVCAECIYKRNAMQCVGIFEIQNAWTFSPPSPGVLLIR